jgi:DNA-binding XRE family transcriptional regulator
MKSQNNNETIGDKIKQLRNKQGLTQDELARKVRSSLYNAYQN